MLNAVKIRDQFGEKFKEAGIPLTTTDTTFLANADPQMVDEAIDSICEDPRKKTDILKAVRKKTSGKLKPEKSTKPKVALEKAPSPDPISEKMQPNDEKVLIKHAAELGPKYKRMHIGVSVFVNAEEKLYKIHVDSKSEGFDGTLFDIIDCVFQAYYTQLEYKPKTG